MSMDKVQKNINDLERKLGKSNKIVAKGDKIGLKDAIKLGRKSNAMVSSINKGIKEYDVRATTLKTVLSRTDKRSRAPIQQTQRATKSTHKWKRLLV